MAAAQPQPAESRIEAEVRRANALLRQRQFAQALDCAQSLLAEAPANRDVLYLVAVNQRYLGRIADALRTLARLEQSHPDFGRLFQERGHCYRNVGENATAMLAYERAVELNVALEASWRALAELAGASGQADKVQTAERELALLGRLPRPVVAGMGMFNEGDLFGAERVLRQFLQSHGDHIEAMRLLAQIGMRLDVLDDAEFLLESVLTFAPDYHAARFDYATVLSQRHKYQRALAEAEKLLQLEPDNRAFRTIHANARVGIGDHEEALRIFRELAAETPDNAAIQLSAAHALKTLGRQPEAVAAYRAAADARPGFGDAYWSLANLKTYRFDDEQIDRIRAQEALPDAAPVDRYHLCFALGKAFEDRGEYQQSFHFYARGNELKHAECHYDAAQMERALQQQAVVGTREFMQPRQGAGCPAADPIFIVGLPRAGSTLLEQILASHSQVEGTMELAEIPRQALRLSGRDATHAGNRYPAVLQELTDDQLKRLGEKYLADTSIYRRGRPFFIDKMPNNFRHIALIQLILPNARIIDARREPMACCFSNFKQLFATGQEFTYSLDDLARYYRNYVEVMAHWDRVLPGRILRVQHEHVVEDLAGSVRRMLDYCGLPFEPQCLEFYRTERSVRTASSEQVRQPIFKEGLDQWRNYQPWLGPLKMALGDLVTP
jgi:tetratricopeptide (TPR) repeat protein